VQPVAAPLGLQQHGEGGILGDLDGSDGIHHDDDVERHAPGLQRVLGAW